MTAIKVKLDDWYNRKGNLRSKRHNLSSTLLRHLLFTLIFAITVSKKTKNQRMAPKNKKYW